MVTTVYLYSNFFNMVIDKALPFPVGPYPGPGWDEVNGYISCWNNICPGPDIYPRACYKMCATFQAMQDISNHNKSIFELSSWTVATLSMIGYDTFQYGPVVGGLNGDYLSHSNPFANSGVQFQDVKSGMLEHAKVRFEYYKALERTVHGNNLGYVRSEWIER